MVDGMDQLRQELKRAARCGRFFRPHHQVFSMTRTGIGLVILCTLTAFGCDRPAQARQNAVSDTVQASSPLKVDSIMPTAVALERFQSELPPVTGLSAAVRSRDELVSRFVGAVETADAATLDSLLVSKAEYAFLYYPSSVYSRKPYQLPPGIAWLLSEQNSTKGLTRVTRRLGGKRLDFRGYECSAVETEGENRFWRTCLVSYLDPTSGQPVTKKLFGAIMERAGRYKFLSYVNDF
jgi:hypothetical protein